MHRASYAFANAWAVESFTGGGGSGARGTRLGHGRPAARPSPRARCLRVKHSRALEAENAERAYGRSLSVEEIGPEALTVPLTQ